MVVRQRRSARHRGSKPSGSAAPASAATTTAAGGYAAHVGLDGAAGTGRHGVLRSVFAGGGSGCLQLGVRNAIGDHVDSGRPPIQVHSR
jgi:hypothetical protein